MIHNRNETLRQQLQQTLGLELVIGVPDGTAADLFLFPYRLLEEQFHRNAADNTTPPPDCIDFLLIPTPRFEYGVLEKAVSHLQHHSFTESDTCMIEYRRNTLSVSELAQLFLAAHIPLTMCSAHQARFFNKA